MKGNDIICINDKFPEETMAFYREHNVITPTSGTIYSCREIINHMAAGKTGILLNELRNPPVPIKTNLISGTREVTWDINRFSTLSGEVLTMELVKELTNA